MWFEWFDRESPWNTTGTRYLVTTAIAIAMMLASAYSHNHTGLFGFTLYGSVFVILTWWLGKAPSAWGLLLVWLGLCYFVLEGEGFAVNDKDDAQRLVMMIVSSGLSIALVGLIRDRSLLLVRALETSDRNYQDTLVRLHELSHRMGNDLSTLSAVANLQANGADPATQQALHRLRDRIHVFSSLYRKLGLHNIDRSNLNTAEFLTKLCDDLQELHKGLRPISLVIHAGDVPLTPHRAMIAGIMLNESVTNAFKYAFPDNRAGHIEVHFDYVNRSDPKMICLSVRDDGVGIQPLPEPVTSSSGMGQKIMHAMSSQINGHYTLTRRGDRTVSEVCFPVK